MIIFLYLLTISAVALIGISIGYGAGKVGRKKDTSARQALREINRWAIQNQDVHPEAATVIQSVVGDYYEKENTL